MSTIGPYPPSGADGRITPLLTASGTQHRQVAKPWGCEIIWAETPDYVGKFLQIRAGARLSLQYHDQKTETQSLLAGRVLLQHDRGDGILREVELVPGVSVTIRPYERHRLIALTDASVLEVSTPERGSTFRIEDDYGRPHETEQDRTAPAP